MAYPRRTNVNVAAVDNYLQAVIKQLMEEYTCKKTRFNHLKDDVIELQYSVEQINTARRNEKDNSERLETSPTSLKVKIGEIKGRLSSMMWEIGSLQTEDSEEHRYLRAVIDQSEHRICPHPMSEDHQQLITDIRALREIHEINCKEKQDLENIINRAHHQLNKLEKVLRNEQQLRKENMKVDHTTTTTKQTTTKQTPQNTSASKLGQNTPNRGLAVRDMNSRGSLH